MTLSYYYTNHTTNIQAYYIYTNLSPRAQSLALATNGICSLTYLGQAGKNASMLLAQVPNTDHGNRQSCHGESLLGRMKDEG